MAAPAPEPFRVQVLDKLAALVTAAFALVAALAWNEAIQLAIAAYIPAGSQLLGRALYAVAVTLIAVLAAVWIGSVVARARARAVPTMRPRTP